VREIYVGKSLSLGALLVVFNKEIHQSEKNLAFFCLGCIRK
jgi:hypothetical protein